MDSDPGKVPATVLRYLHDRNWTVWLSVVAVWEILVKLPTGKLSLRADLETVVAGHLSQTPLQLLPVRYDHVLGLRHLPLIHKDPFDRMLVAQAIAERAVLLTDDALIRQNPVRIDW